MQSTILDTAFDVANEEGTPPRTLLPAGKYKAEITNATVGPTKNGKGQAVSLTWVITEGDYENRLVFQNVLIQHESEEAQRFGRQKFKDVCSSCGITSPVTDLDVLTYKTCVISVVIRKDKSGEYEDKNEVARVNPLVSWNGSNVRLLKQASEQALAAQPMQIGSARVKPGTLRALAVSYFASPVFRTKKPSTQRIYRYIIDRLCLEHSDKRPALLHREHVIKLIAVHAEKPGMARAVHRSLRALMQHAVEIGMRAGDPTRDVRAIPARGDGYHSWTEAEIAQFEKQHPIGSRARLALALLLYSGQRRSDVVTMGRQHMTDGELVIRQQKTGRTVWIPVHETLASIIAETPSGNLTFLVNEHGKPYTAAGFGNWFRAQCRTASLTGCSAHGLRKAAARRLAGPAAARMRSPLSPAMPP
jgi:integrase